MEASTGQTSEVHTRAREGPRSGPGAYAGVGSRSALDPILELVESLARKLALGGWTLRTGMSPGVDQAFYRGAVAVGGVVELYLPWAGFEAEALAFPRRSGGAGDGRVRVQNAPSAQAYELAARYHPRWRALREPERLLLARDVHQVLGVDLRTPVSFALCWTAEGSTDGKCLFSDGTGQALRVAAARGIEVVNLSRPDHLQRLTRLASIAPAAPDAV